jgi:hypothetical protein
VRENFANSRSGHTSIVQGLSQPLGIVFRHGDQQSSCRLGIE